MKKLITLVLLALTINAVAQIPTTGLVGYWPFTGNASDGSGNNNNGINNGASLTNDRFGNPNSAYDFSSAGYIDCNNTFDEVIAGSNKKFSISFWIKPSSTNNNNMIVSKHSDAGCAADERQFFIRQLNDIISVEYYGNSIGTLGRFICGSSVLSNYAKWYHVVVEYDGTINTNDGLDRIKMIVDNVPEITTLSCIHQNVGSFPFDLISGVAHFGIGNYLTSSGVPCQSAMKYNGKIDDIRIYNRELNQSEISNLYNEGLCYQNISVTDTLIIRSTITGFNPVTYQNTIKVWPNPTNDHITIDNGNIANMTGYQLKITNSLGQQVFQSSINQQQFYVDISTWSGKGIYFIYLINGQGNTIDIKKIVLQ